MGEREEGGGGGGGYGEGEGERRRRGGEGGRRSGPHGRPVQDNLQCDRTDFPASSGYGANLDATTLRPAARRRDTAMAPHLCMPPPITHNTSVAMVAKPPPAPKNSVALLPPGAKCSGAAGAGARRAFLGGLIAVGASSLLGPGVASAASKRRAQPPAPAAAEKKDPSVSGVQAKVLASKKRKEAMKEFVAKMREKGKPVN
ncbi:hypothetical protein ABZP36_035898 [Zizania latifolia]